METKSEYDVYYDDDNQDNIYDKIEEKTNDEETPNKVTYFTVCICMY